MDVARVVQLANTLLVHAGIHRQVKTVKQCNSTVFTQLYEALTGARVPGMVLQAPTSETVKCQAVVDALTIHLSPHVTLEHIRGEDLAAYDTMAIQNLLDIFSVLFHLPVSAAAATDGGEEEESSIHSEHSDANDSNVISAEGFSVISEVIREELGPSTSHSTNSTAELLRSVPRARLPWEGPHPPPPTDSSSTTAGPPSTLHTTSSYSEVGLTGDAHHPKNATAASRGDRIKTSQARPSVIIPSGSSTEPSPSPISSPPPPLHTPPISPLHRRQLLSSPLHHSTPHLNTRSRIFRNRAEQPPQLSTSQAPDFPATEHYTELTRPLPLDTAGCQLTSPPIKAPPHSTRERGVGPASETTRGASDHSTVLTASSTEERAANQASEVTTAVQTDTPPLQTNESTGVQSGDEEQSGTSLPTTSPPVTPPSSPPASQRRLPPRVHFSASTEWREHCRQSVSTADQSGNSTFGDLSFTQTQSDLESRAAQTRASVLAALYQSYLRELKATKPRDIPPTHHVKHPKSSKYHQKHKRTSSRSKPARKPTREPASLLHHATREDEVVETSTVTDSSEEENAADHKQREKATECDTLLSRVEKEFPFIHVSPSTMHKLWQKQLRQITALTKPPHHNTSNVKQVAEMERRQRALLHVIRKELDHTKRLQMRQEQHYQQQAVKAGLLAKRQASARARRYYNEYELHLKAKLQKRRTREEQIFRRAFEDGLDIQRERARELQRYAKEKQQSLARRHREQLESMENYYRDQFALLAEATAKEREEVVVREKAQNQMAQQLRRELRQRTEKEIRTLQESLDKEEDVAHFRQLDAQSLKHKLNCMTLTT